MKKRESKSEAFSAEPFEYQFMYAPAPDVVIDIRIASKKCAFLTHTFSFFIDRL